MSSFTSEASPTCAPSKAAASASTGEPGAAYGSMPSAPSAMMRRSRSVGSGEEGRGAAERSARRFPRASRQSSAHTASLAEPNAIAAQSERSAEENDPSAFCLPARKASAAGTSNARDGNRSPPPRFPDGAGLGDGEGDGEGAPSETVTFTDGK